ncbi:DUF4123 domain-containing protein [Vibrio metoecus]|uniref:DUF4123 domain-containing protein n=1 Tax=Vibrio metoecus TaxID=1481663 RepID=UPI00272CA1D5|nr:DUF4123 domain-containing protein [Vibrio metoecus]WKY92026.1 DUF4123 domain-containing protein [Vibrio metoecus]
MIQQWLTEQETPVFWLLDQQGFKCVIAANNGIGFDGTQILFHGETFAPVMSLSPWLIPVSDKVLELPDELLQQGIFLTSHSSTSELLIHLQSLLIAALEGEEVLFRFYDTEVILPMLDAMLENERNDFLGSVERLATANKGTFRIWENTRMDDFVSRPTTWWKMQPYHLAPLYRTQVHAQVLERRFWEKLPFVMEQIDEPYLFIKNVLDEGIEFGLDPEQAELLVLNSTIAHSFSSIDQLRDALQLNQQELQEIIYIREKLA